VRALMPCNLLWLNADKGQGVKVVVLLQNISRKQVRFPLRIDMPTFHIFHPSMACW